MRCLLLALALLLSAAVAREPAPAAAADSLADLRQPSSTIPGCVNDWGPLGTGSGVTEPTCEGKAALAEWNEHAAAVNTARDLIVQASNQPDRSDPQAVINALHACAGAADAMARLYHPAPSALRDFDRVLVWMRPWFERAKMPIPATIGDGFRTLAAGLAKPGLLREERNALYGQAAVFATRESELATELEPDVERQTDEAVRAAHRTALKAAEAAENGHPRWDTRAAIAAAAGPRYRAIAQEQTRRAFAAILKTLIGITGFTVILVALGFRRFVDRLGIRGALGFSLLFVVALPLSWLPFALLHAATGWPDGWLTWLLWPVLFVVLLALGPRLLPGPLRRVWAVLFAAAPSTTHGSAYFGGAREAAGHLKPAAPTDAFALGDLPNISHGRGRFYHDGHILTCAPTGAGKGIGAVIPNLIEYPGSAFVLDLKGENYAVTARPRRAAGQDVFLIDPFAITGAAGQALNWLDTLDPGHPDVVGRAGALADMLVVRSGFESEPHWNDTARDLLRGFLVHVAGLPAERRTMAELRSMLTAPEDPFAEILADMLAAPERGGQRLVSRTAAVHLGRPERERGSVLSTAQRHTAWLDDPRLCATLGRSDFSLHDLKRRPMTVYLAIPPDRLRASLGFVRGFIGLALDAITAVPGRSAYRVAFFLDEFGQLGRLDNLVDGLTLMRGYGAQLWLFVQDLSQLKAVYPRWPSFLANTSQQYFGTADYDTAHYLSNALGHYTIAFETANRSRHTSRPFKPGTQTAGSGEHRHGRPLLTPDEIMRLGPTRPIVMIAGEPPFLLDRLDYHSDSAYAGRFDPTRCTSRPRRNDGHPCLQFRSGRSPAQKIARSGATASNPVKKPQFSVHSCRPRRVIHPQSG
jgi:type IV secretory pathway TraG/TraD family ATPase VirD4